MYWSSFTTPEASDSGLGCLPNSFLDTPIFRRYATGVLCCDRAEETRQEEPARALLTRGVARRVDLGQALRGRRRGKWAPNSVVVSNDQTCARAAAGGTKTNSVSSDTSMYVGRILCKGGLQRGFQTASGPANPRTCCFRVIRVLFLLPPTILHQPPSINHPPSTTLHQLNILLTVLLILLTVPSTSTQAAWAGKS